MIVIRVLVPVILVVLATASAEARKWTDVSGTYSIEADLIGFDDESVIFQRENKELGSMRIDQLSEADREFLKSKEAKQIHESNMGRTQTWTMKSGLKVVGKVVDYTEKELTLQRRRGKTYVNDKVYDNLPEVYQQMLPEVVSHLESADLPDKAAVDAWVRSLRGLPKTYNLEGVVFELENGDEYVVPFFLFSEQDQQLLKSGWDAWVSDRGDPSKRDDHAFHLESLASAYNQNQAIDRRIAMMNLNLQAVQAGLTSLWEVTLYPGPGNPYPPKWVVFPGRNSEIATQGALRANPGYYSGPVRRVSR
jgi:hypothetical protein